MVDYGILRKRLDESASYDTPIGIYQLFQRYVYLEMLIKQEGLQEKIAKTLDIDRVVSLWVVKNEGEAVTLLLQEKWRNDMVIVKKAINARCRELGVLNSSEEFI